MDPVYLSWDKKNQKNQKKNQKKTQRKSLWIDFIIHCHFLLQMKNYGLSTTPYVINQDCQLTLFLLSLIKQMYQEFFHLQHY